MVKIGDIPASQVRLQPVQAPMQSIAAAQATGGAIAQLGYEGKEQAVDELEREAASYAVKATTDFEVEQHAELERLKLEHGNLNDFREVYDKKLDEAYTKAMEAAPNGYAVEAMRDRLEQMQGSLRQRANGWLSNEKQRMMAVNAEQSMNQYANMVLSDPDSFDDVVNRLEGNLAAGGSYLTPSQMSNIKRKGLDAVFSAKVKGEILRGNLTAAEELLQDDGFKGVIDAGSYARMTEGLRQAKNKVQLDNIAVMVPEEQAKLLENARGDEKTFNALRRNMEQANKARENDPVGFGKQYGLVPYTPLDINDVEVFTEQMRERKLAVQQMAAAYGTPVKAFDEFEVRQMIRDFNDKDAEDQLSLLKGLHEAWGGAMPEVAAQISEKDKGLAFYAGMVGSSPEMGNTVLDALEGRKIMRENPNVAKVFSGAEPTMDFAKYVGNAFEFVPEAEPVLRDAVRSLAAKRYYEDNPQGEYNPDILEDALKEILGGEKGDGIAEVRDRKILLPYGINDADFEDAVDALKEDDYVAFSLSGGKPIDKRGNVLRPAALQDATLIQRGLNQWYLYLGDGFVADESGEPYILMMNAERVRSKLDEPPVAPSPPPLRGAR